MEGMEWVHYWNLTCTHSLQYQRNGNGSVPKHWLADSCRPSILPTGRVWWMNHQGPQNQMNAMQWMNVCTPTCSIHLHPKRVPTQRRRIISDKFIFFYKSEIAFPIKKVLISLHFFGPFLSITIRATKSNKFAFLFHPFSGPCPIRSVSECECIKLINLLISCHERVHIGGIVFAGPRYPFVSICFPCPLSPRDHGVCNRIHGRIPESPELMVHRAFGREERAQGSIN